jgi:hypothetical protein
MNAENLVPLRETCEALDRAGIRFPESYFVWVHRSSFWTKQGYPEWELTARKDLNPRISKYTKTIKIYSAPTLAELLEWLPDHFYDKKRLIYLRIGKSMGDGLIIRYINADIKEQVCRFQGLNPSESAAQLALWVVENGYHIGETNEMIKEGNK